MLTNSQPYTDLRPDYYRRRDPARTTKHLVAQLKRLSHTVTLQEAAAKTQTRLPISRGR